MRTGKLYVVFLLAIISSSCTGAEQNTASGFPSRRTFSKDTVFGSLHVNNTNRDSLENLYGKFVMPGDQALIDQGEFVKAKISLRVPLYPSGWVTDFENIFSSHDEYALDSILSAYEDLTRVEIGVVTIDSTWTTREGFDSFVLRLHNFWGEGKKEKNNGILIGISQGYKLIRISYGDGIRSVLSDEKTKEIIDEHMIPEFIKSDYFTGTRNGIFAITDQLGPLEAAHRH